MTTFFTNHTCPPKSVRLHDSAEEYIFNTDSFQFDFNVSPLGRYDLLGSAGVTLLRKTIIYLHLHHGVMSVTHYCLTCGSCGEHQCFHIN